MSEERAGPLLLTVLGGSAAWVLHFLGSYLLVAIACAHAWSGLRATLGIATLVLAGAASWATVRSYRGWRAEAGAMPWDAALSETHGWRAVVLMSGVVLGALATGTILAEGLQSLFVPPCSGSSHT